MSGEFVVAQSAADCEASLGRSILRDNSQFAHQSLQPTRKVAHHSAPPSAFALWQLNRMHFSFIFLSLRRFYFILPSDGSKYLILKRTGIHKPVSGGIWSQSRRLEILWNGYIIHLIPKKKGDSIEQCVLEFKATLCCGRAAVGKILSRGLILRAPYSIIMQHNKKQQVKRPF
jgi:hypothetical protein